MSSVISGVILRTQTDERLVALSRTGHQRAFETIVERYRAELSRSVRRLLPSASVEDVLQSTHLEAWKALSGGTEVRELRGWLHRIARNAAIASATRGYDYDELKDALGAAPGPEEELERREVVRRALRGIAELPERQREALLAVAVGGRSHAELAFDLGISDTAARQLVHRARVALLAMATVLMPPQLVLWAARAGHTIVAGKAAAGGAALGGSLTGPALKAGAVALAVGSVAAGVAPLRHALAPPPPTPARHHHHHGGRMAGPPAYLAATVRVPAVPGGVSRGQLVPAATEPAPSPPRRAHHRRRVRPAAGGRLIPTPAGAPSAVPVAGDSAPPAATVAPTAAAAPTGLAAFIAWAVAHSSPGTTGVNGVTVSGSSAGQSTAGAPGQASGGAGRVTSPPACTPSAAAAPGQTSVAGAPGAGASGAATAPSGCPPSGAGN